MRFCSIAKHNILPTHQSFNFYCTDGYSALPIGIILYPILNASKPSKVKMYTILRLDKLFFEPKYFCNISFAFGKLNLI